MTFLKSSLAYALVSVLGLGMAQGGFADQASPALAQPPVQAAQQTPEQLQQLVAPIALYPDALAAQVLAASTYPDQIVIADRWMQQHHDLTGDSLARAVNDQTWDPSVKALTQFPTVLAYMDKNLAWTSALGDAYINQQQDVTNAVQVMRQRAQKAGNLKSTPQEMVATQGQTIVIQAANPGVVYVPVYDPWTVYGAPLVVYPGWVPVTGLFVTSPGGSFGVGFGLGLFAGFGWGWNHWGFDWQRRNVIYDHTTYITHSTVFINRGRFYHAGPAPVFHGGAPMAGRAFHAPAVSAAPHALPGGIRAGSRPSAFSGFNPGGIARSYSFRGQSSLGRGDRVGGGFPGGGFSEGFHGGRGHR